MAIKLQPLGNMVIFKPKKAEAKTKGGVFLPESVQEKPQEGVVVAVGPGRVTESGKREPMDVKVGDIVIYPKFGGNDLNIDGEELIIMPSSTLWAKRVKK